MDAHLLADRYELGGVLGSGGMADVHRAWDTRLRRHVAIKLFRAESGLADARRFENEIRTLAALAHPRLVTVYDTGSADGTPFVVLQLVEGQTLRDRIGDGPLSEAEVRRIGADIADALDHVHGSGVVHRDVKPSNILVNAAGDALLADFGLATVTGSTRLTRSDQLVGTAAYLAPEQVRGEGIDFPVDVYALGLVLLECLTGQREYQGSEIEAAVARLHRQPTVPDGLSEDLARLLRLMTSLSPRRRPTAAECARALREQATRVLPLPPRRGGRLVAASVLAALLTAAGLTAAALHSPPPVESAPPTSTPATGEAPPAAGSTGHSSDVVPGTTAVQPPAQVNAPAPRNDNSGPGKGKNSGKGKGKNP